MTHWFLVRKYIKLMGKTRNQIWNQIIFGSGYPVLPRTIAKSAY
jgi:hypothetical protein